MSLKLYDSIFPVKKPIAIPPSKLVIYSKKAVEETEAYINLLKEKRPFKTLIIDTISAFYDISLPCNKYQYKKSPR